LQKDSAMPKIQLTMKSAYCADWTKVKAIVDLVANAHDAEVQDGAPLCIDHIVRADGTGVLRIANEGTTLPTQALLFGHTTKVGRSDTIGKFGEGLKIALLVLVREGHAVKIRNGSEVWTPVLEDSDTFPGEKILAIHIEKGRKAENRVRIEIDGVEKAEWEEMKKLFLFISEPTRSIKCSSGTLIQDADYVGRVYVKGVFVQRDASLQYGYDLGDAEIDRDRKMIESWNLQYKTRNILLEALGRTAKSTNAKEAEEAVDAIYRILADGSSTEAQGVHDANSFWTLSTQTAEALAAKFKKEHGEGAVPVATLAESRDVEHLGKTGVVVAKSLGAALSKVLGTGEKLVEELKKEVVRTYSWGELTGPEQDVLLEALVTVDAVRSTSLDSISIVDFRSPTLRGQQEGSGANSKIFLGKKMLASFDDCLFVLVHEVAHATSNANDGEQSHVLEIQRIWSEIVKGMRAEKAQKAGGK